MLTKGLFTSKTDEWGTPKSIFDELNKTFHFTIDVCADASNHKCEKYFTKEQDGLRQDWGGVLYGATLRMAEKLGNGWRSVRCTEEWQLC